MASQTYAIGVQTFRKICDRDFAGRYGRHSSKVLLIAANFSEERVSRGIEYEILEESKR